MEARRRRIGANPRIAFALALLMVVQFALTGCGGISHQHAVSGPVAPEQAVYAGDVNGDGLPGVGDAIGILRVVVGLNPASRVADADGDGVTGVNDAIRVLRCVVGLDDWPLGFTVQDNELKAAVGEAGEGCIAVSGGGSGSAWTQNDVLSVPAGADELFIGSLSTQLNADLQGVEITLTSPGGTQTIVLRDGQVTCTGFAEVDLTDAATDADLGGYFDTLTAELPASPTEQDYSALLDRVLGADPESPAPAIPDGLFADIDGYENGLAGYTNTIVADRDGLTPSDGLFVLGPEAGDWTVEVSAGAGAGAFSLMAWTTPDGADLSTTVDNVAEALSGDVGATQAGVSAAACEGCDPGCPNLINDYRYPAPNTPAFYRSFAIQAVYDVIVWLLLRGIFTKVIGKLIDLGKALPAQNIITQDKLKTLSIFTCASVYKEVLRHSELAAKAFWRFAYTVGSPDNYNRICYIGLSTGLLSWSWEPTVSLQAGETQTLNLCAGNAMKDVIPREFWGRWAPGQPRVAAAWEIDPAVGVATLRATGDQSESCEIEAYEDPLMRTATMTVLIANQPARGEWPVKILGSYWLSGSDSAISAIQVDDNLDVFRNGKKIVDTGTGLSGAKGPFQIGASPGDVLRFEVRDTYGHCASMGAVYLLSAGGGQSTLATAGFNDGCGHGAGNRGVVFTDTFTIPF